MAETIVPTSLDEEVSQRYRIYAMSVITARALPDVRDGMKPVQRRIMYTMYHDLRLLAEGRPRKCSKICGDVVGNYHPHGTVAAYEALVRLAQNWVMREPLVDGQGNFGSVDGDSPAADRYTEAKLHPIAERLMSELRQQTVNMRPNYENTREEPVVLPAQYPNLLVNGSSGIAVGMATNMPPHNLADVLKAAIFLIENPDATVAQLLDKVKGPDFPLGGKVVTDRAALRKIYEEGTGSIKIHGEWKEEHTAKKNQIIVTSIPYGVDKGKLESDIGAIIAERKLPQLLNIANETNEKDGLRIALEVKPDANSQLVMAYLYKHTDLQSNFAYNLTALIPLTDEETGKESLQPERLNLKSILRHFLDFRLQTVRRRFEYELEQLRRRIHVLEGFRIVFNALDEALKLIRSSSGKADAAERLIARFGLDQIQADAVLDAQLYKIAQMEIRKILDELKEKKAQAKAIEAILASEKKLWGVIKDELTQLGEQFGTRRRTRMAGADDIVDFDPDAYIPRENTNVILTRDGWIKRVGRLASVKGTRVREGDEVIAVVPGSTLDHVVFFADDGAAYTMQINDIPSHSGYGDPVTKFFRLADQVKIIAAVTTDKRFVPEVVKGKKGEPDGPYVLAVTQQGQSVRIPFAIYHTASTKAGRRYIRLANGDRVVLAQVVTDQPSLFLASAKGHVLHFSISDINILSSAGKGVLGIKLAKGDRCLGGTVMVKPMDKFVVETSKGKKIDYTQCRTQTTSRGGKGFPAVKRSTLARVVPNEIELIDWDAVEGRSNGKTTHRAKANGHSVNGERTLFD